MGLCGKPQGREYRSPGGPTGEGLLAQAHSHSPMLLTPAWGQQLPARSCLYDLLLPLLRPPVAVVQARSGGSEGCGP